MNDTTLARIADSLERIASALERNNPKSVSISDGSSTLTISAEAPSQPQIIPEPEQIEAPAPVADPALAQPKEIKPSITLDRIRKMVVTLSAQGKEKKDAVREVVTSYAPNVSGIPADKYPEVMDKLTALRTNKEG